MPGQKNTTFQRDRWKFIFALAHNLFVSGISVCPLQTIWEFWLWFSASGYQYTALMRCNLHTILYRSDYRPVPPFPCSMHYWRSIPGLHHTRKVLCQLSPGSSKRLFLNRCWPDKKHPLLKGHRTFIFLFLEFALRLGLTLCSPAWLL